MSKNRSEGSAPRRDYSDAPYSVGKGKTPVGTRYKKGECGNPNGRPKKKKEEVEADAVVDAIFDELAASIPIGSDGKRSVTKARGVAKRLVNMALTGDLKAIMFLVNLQRLAPRSRRAGIGKIIYEVVHTGPPLADDQIDPETRPSGPPPKPGLVRYGVLHVDGETRNNMGFILTSATEGQFWTDTEMAEKVKTADKVQIEPFDHKVWLDLTVESVPEEGTVRFTLMQPD